MQMFEHEEFMWILWIINGLFRELNNLKRWSALISESGRNELGKQELNSICCFILAVEYEARTAKKLRWELFPKIALYRAFQKGNVNFDIVENTLHEIEGSENPSVLFNNVTEYIIKRKLEGEFCEWIKVGCGTIEERIYKAATKIATVIELREIRPKINRHLFREVYHSVLRSSKKYSDISGFNALFKEAKKDKPKGSIKAIKDVAQLRNRDRWSVCGHSVKCSVLGHMFDTGVFSYFISLEKGLTDEDAARNFFIGIFHDVAEAYTGDIPSPIKDYINGFREKSEDFELKMLKENFYPYFPDYVQGAIRNVMLEEEENKDRKAICKIADYVSAISEIHRQAVKGSKDADFYKALIGHKEKLHKYGAEESEIGFYRQVEKYCRKAMLVDERYYLITMIEMTYINIARSTYMKASKATKYKKMRKLYRQLLVLGYQLKNSGADEFEISEFERLKRMSRNYF